MKKILIVNTANTGFTGITSVILNYVRKTHQIINYEFVLCGKVENSFLDELKALGRNVYIPYCSRVKQPMKYYRWLKNIIKSNHYDCIHVHGNSGTMYLEIHAAKKNNIPIRIAHSHNTSCKYQFAHKLLSPYLNRELTQAVACSDLAGQWLFNKEYCVLTNGIEISKFSYSAEVRNEYRERLKIDEKFVIGHVAYMDTEKNHLFLLRVFKRLISENKNFVLMLIGDGRLRSEIEKYIQENDLQDYVMLLGKRSDVANLYQCMDAFVLPSLYEGFPISLVEAQTAGLPCIVSNRITSQVNLTGNVTFIGIQDLDIEEWILKLLELINLDVNRTNAKKDISESEFNMDNCISKLLNIYQLNS